MKPTVIDEYHGNDWLQRDVPADIQALDNHDGSYTYRVRRGRGESWDYTWTGTYKAREHVLATVAWFARDNPAI